MVFVWSRTAAEHSSLALTFNNILFCTRTMNGVVLCMLYGIQLYEHWNEASNIYCSNMKIKTTVDDWTERDTREEIEFNNGKMSYGNIAIYPVYRSAFNAQTRPVSCERVSATDSEKQNASTMSHPSSFAKRPQNHEAPGNRHSCLAVHAWHRLESEWNGNYSAYMHRLPTTLTVVHLKCIWFGKSTVLIRSHRFWYRMNVQYVLFA